MNQIQKNESGTFIWRVAAIHTISYFIAGIFALLFMNYKAHFASESMSVIMRPVDDPVVALGPGMQIIRGIIIALVLLPFIDVFTSKNGWLKFAGLVLGLSYVSTVGPTFGSFEGYIYTKIPLQYHILGIPEALLYTSLFSGLLFFWYKKPGRAWNIITAVMVVLIVMMSILGYLSGLGLIEQ